MPAPTHSTIAEDYRAARTAAAAVDLAAWTLLRLRGPDTRSFLQGLGSQDFENAPAASALQTLFLNEKGRPVALAWVAIDHDGRGAWVIADEGARAILRPHLERFRIMEDVEFDGPNEAPRLIGVVGPERAALLRRIQASTPGATILDSEPMSFLLSSERVAAPAQAPIHPEAFEAWRIAAGVPRTGVDFDLERIATELDLPGAISPTKGCYVGQEVVSRTSNRGQVRRSRRGFRFPWTGSPIPARSEIRAGETVVGYVTSTAREPGSDEGLGMGYLSNLVAETAEDLVAAGPTAATALHPGRWPL